MSARWCEQGINVMGGPFSEERERSLKQRLIAVIEAGEFERNEPLADDVSLIKSGRLDSLGLFSVALFIEREIGHRIDLTAFDLAAEWDTIGEIIDFIQRVVS